MKHHNLDISSLVFVGREREDSKTSNLMKPYNNTDILRGKSFNQRKS